MFTIKADSAAKAFLQSSRKLLEESARIGDLTEELNAIIEIEDFQYGSLEQKFDAKFREIFDDERIDYASAVTFIEPKKTVKENGEASYEYETIKKGWKSSYWGRMISWEDKMNQIENVLRVLKKGKNAKRCEIMVYSPRDQRKMFGHPCLLCIDIKPRNKRLHLTANFRSQRITKSGYADYSALIGLGNFLCRESGMTLEKVTCVVHSLHVDHSEKDEIDNTRRILSLFDGSY